MNGGFASLTAGVNGIGWIFGNDGKVQIVWLISDGT
jgi:hypothetical protein